MKKKFDSICRMSQADLKKYVEKELKITHNKVISEDGFVYAQGTFPVLLVAHLDTVHATLPTLIMYDKADTTISSPQGIGGDDRCGVYMILEIIKKYHCSVLFCEDEEIGAIGAEKFTKWKPAQKLTFNYIIEFDRRGKNDAVFYDCDNDLFEEFITKDFYKTAFGSFSDISVLAPFLGCAAVNLSCGYYNAHTTNEYVVLSEMQASIDAASKILARTNEDDAFEYIEVQYSDYYYGYSSYGITKTKNYFVEYMDEDCEVKYDEVSASSMEEAVGIFCMEHPSIPYSSIFVMEI
jgi:acetylornithine deacetylase/succinyl-diaminopimelate desuccinylase-like protein